MEVGKEAITARDEKLAMVREAMGEVSPKEEIQEIDAPEAETETETEETPDKETEEPEEETEVAISEEKEPGEGEPQPHESSLTREFNKLRSQKRELEAERAAEKAQWEAEKAKLLEENNTFRKNQPPPQPFIEYAKSKGISDPKDVKELYDTFKAQLDVDYGSKLNEIDKKIQSFEQQEAQRQELTAWDDSMRHFDGEFQTILPSLESEYKPTAEQLSEVYDLLADLAHEAKYHDKDLDYIAYKEQIKLEEILGTRKRKGFISRSAPMRTVQKEETPSDEHSRIMALRREQQGKKTKGDGFDGPVGDTNI